MIPFYLLNCLGLVIVFDAGDAHPFASVLLAISFLVSLTCFTYAVFSRSLSATSFAYLLYATYGFILAGLMQVRSDRFYWINNAVQREYIPDAAVIVLLSTLAFALGYFCRVASRPTPIERPLTEVPQGQQNRIAQATFVVCLLSFAYLVMALGTYGVAAFIGTRHTTGIALLSSGGNTATYGLVFTLTRGMAVASMVIAGYVLLRMRIRNQLDPGRHGAGLPDAVHCQFPARPAPVLADRHGACGADEHRQRLVPALEDGAVRRGAAADVRPVPGLAGL